MEFAIAINAARVNPELLDLPATSVPHNTVVNEVQLPAPGVKPTEMHIGQTRMLSQISDSVTEYTAAFIICPVLPKTTSDLSGAAAS